ncbi:MAG: diaminopimelate epimerase, partial [Bacteroidota bacterium]
DVTEIIKHSETNYELYTGSPHLIQFKSDIDSIDVKQEGAKIRYSDKYVQKGINVNFVQVILNNELSIRTYERGVEEETLACGTGITAAALAFAKSVKLSGAQRILVHSRGGALNVEFDAQENSFIKIILEGPASYIFKGEIHI